MKEKIKQVALFATSPEINITEIALQCKEVLQSQNIKVLADKEFSISLKSGINKATQEHIKNNADLLISIGGDGTMISAAKKYGFFGIPVLGINLGKLGFLTDIAPFEITERITEVIQGKYKTDKRSFLSSNVQGRKKNYIALNEIVLHSGSVAQMIEFDLEIVYTQRADGLIVSTVTGSTAYSLSGGGPIIHPSVKAISITPMFPQSLSSSPFLVNLNSKIKITLRSICGSAKLSFDSAEEIEVKNNQVITIQKDKKELTLIHPKNHDFFEACREKLGWGKGIVRK
jgi:NAD+ kinase